MGKKWTKDYGVVQGRCNSAAVAGRPRTRPPASDWIGVSTGLRGSDPRGNGVDGTRSTVGHIHAAGDVTADIALVNVAELEGRYAAEAMFGLAPRPIH